MAKKRKSTSIPPRTRDFPPGERFTLTWLNLPCGVCVMGTRGGSFGAFTSAAGAADFLRDVAMRIELDAQIKTEVQK
jgi:hypothetical protein